LLALPYGQARAAHEIVFEREEPSPIRRLTQGLLGPAHYKSPVVDGRLPLRDDLFVDDAIIFDHISSRSVTYKASGGPSIEVRFPEMPYLGIWSKPGAQFVCIEPWHGYASPADFEGDMLEKPGVVLMQPTSSKSFGMKILCHAETDH
jgi:galactose mutarotase-like enzyme